MKNLFVIAALFSVNAFAGTPSESCTKMVNACKENKIEDFMKWTTNYEKPVDAKKVSKSHAAFMDKIKSITCGAEHVSGKNAIVEAEAGPEKRFIPFINVGGEWKFDARTYMSFYAPSVSKTKSVK